MKGFVVALAALAAMTLPAAAQFGAPGGGGAFGSPGIYAAPEGAIGAGAASGAANQQQCVTTYSSGRDGPKTVCSPSGAKR